MKGKVFKIMDVPTVKEIEALLQETASSKKPSKDYMFSMDYNSDAADAFAYGIRGILWEGVAIEERAKIFGNAIIGVDFEVIEEKPEIKLLNP